MIHLSKHTEGTPSVSLNTNHHLWVMMMCQCRLISYNKGTPLVEGVDSGGDCVHVGGHLGEISVLINF